METRPGDTNARAGIVVKCGDMALLERPTPSAKWPSPMLDLPKGHIQAGETPIAAALRECMEETGALFEPKDLSRPIRAECDGAPLFLFLATVDPPFDTRLLSCASTFVDSDGERKPECSGYEWLPIPAQIALVQPRLRAALRHYFRREATGWRGEDCQASASIAARIPANPLSVLSLGYKRDGR